MSAKKPQKDTKSAQSKKAPVKVAKKAVKPVSKKSVVKTKPAASKKAPVKKVKPAAPKTKKVTTAPKKAGAVKKVAPKAASKTLSKSPAKSASKPAAKKILTKKNPAKPVSVVNPISVVPAKPVKLTPFLVKQRERLLHLKDMLLDSMTGVARDSLRSGANGGDASAFGMHQADAGSDAYDRDFALSLLSQEQDSLYEIDQALKRLEVGNYGVCEISNKPILVARLEALPFTRYTVECQAELEKRNRYRVRQPVTSLFGLGDDEGGDGDDDESFETKE